MNSLLNPSHPMRARHARGLKRRWIFPLTLALAAFLIGCGGGAAEDEKEEKTKEVELHAMVETITVETADFHEFVDLNGVTEPLLEASITPEVPGRIVTLTLEEGGTITEGDVVMTVDTSTQKARIGSIQVQLSQTRKELKRTKKLVEQGLATRAALERLQAEERALSKNISEVKVGTKQAQTKAPISGIVTKKMVEEGEYAAPGAPVARVIDISTIVVRVGLPERDVRFVREGKNVEIYIPALRKHYPGKIARIGLEANPRNRTFPLEIHVDNSNLEIRGGMRATATLEKQRLQNAVVIPRDAVMQSLEGSEVFLVADGKASPRSIELGVGATRFVVVDEGLAPGTELVVRGHRGLVKGEPVKVVESTQCCAKQLIELAKTTKAARPGGDPTAEPGSETSGSEEQNAKPEGEWSVPKEKASKDDGAGGGKGSDEGSSKGKAKRKQPSVSEKQN